MKKVVFVTRHDPSKICGGAFATKAYLEAFVKLYPQRVTLFVSDSYTKDNHKYQPSEIIKVKNRAKIKGVIGLFIGKLTRFEFAVKKWLHNNKNNLELVIFDGSIIGGSHYDKFKKLNVKMVTIHHNYELEYHLENKSIETFKGKCSFWIQKLERKAYLNSNYNLFLTNTDKLLFETKFGKSNNFVTGCFEFEKNKINYQNLVIKSSNLNIVISGSLNTFQTVDGIEWFLSKMYLKLKERYPKVNLTITGRSPSESLIKKCKKLNITLIASPKDIKDVLNKNNIYICPTRLGGGLKLRIMDPLALGLPVLVQEKSYRGYEKIASSGLLVSFKDEDDFLERFDELYAKSLNTSVTKSKIKELYLKEFSFESGVNKIKSIFH